LAILNQSRFHSNSLLL